MNLHNCYIFSPFLWDDVAPFEPPFSRSYLCGLANSGYIFKWEYKFTSLHRFEGRNSECESNKREKERAHTHTHKMIIINETTNPIPFEVVSFIIICLWSLLLCFSCEEKKTMITLYLFHGVRSTWKKSPKITATTTKTSKTALLKDYIKLCRPIFRLILNAALAEKLKGDGYEEDREEEKKQKQFAAY